MKYQSNIFHLTGISKPKQLLAKPESCQTMGVSWYKASGTPTKYRVKCRPKNNPRQTSYHDTEDEHVTSKKIENLDPGGVYQVSVVSMLGEVESPEEPERSLFVILRMLTESVAICDTCKQLFMGKSYKIDELFT